MLTVVDARLAALDHLVNHLKFSAFEKVFDVVHGDERSRPSRHDNDRSLGSWKFPISAAEDSRQWLTLSECENKTQKQRR